VSLIQHHIYTSQIIAAECRNHKKAPPGATPIIARVRSVAKPLVRCERTPLPKALQGRHKALGLCSTLQTSYSPNAIQRPLRNCSKLTRQSRDRKVIHNFRIFFTRIEGKTPIILLFRTKPSQYCPFSNPIHRIWTHLSYAGLRERIFIARLML
jgi:hypothetical protein